MFGLSNDKIEQNSNKERLHMSNEEFVTPSALQYRLDTSNIIKNLECFLKAELMQYVPDNNGNVKLEIRKIGEPLVNDRGVQCILTYVNLILNSSVVMGNWGQDWYKYKIADIRRDLTLTLSLNQHDWKLKDGNFMFLINSIMDALTGFLSRLIDNKERESLTPSVRTTETANIRG